MKRIADEIAKGKNLQENLSVYAGKMMSIYSDYSFVRLSMNYYTYYEMVSEAGIKDDKLQDIIETFNKAVSRGIINTASGSEWEELVSSMDDIRNRVISIMQGLTSYVDIFNIYEYCLNRIEYSFYENDAEKKLSAPDDDELAREMIQFILSDNDSVVINSKIAEMVRQLPMRMTKSRFFELLRTGIGVYKGSQTSSVEDFLYMLKTTSMVEISPYIELLSDDIKAIYNEFRSTSFSDMTKDVFDDMRNKKDFAAAYLMQEIDMYMSMGELINDAYVILMSAPYVMDESSDANICRRIIGRVSGMFDSESAGKAYDSLNDDFIRLEGRQEALQTKFSTYDYIIAQVLDEDADILDSLMLDKIYRSLERIQLLESDSIFAGFEKKNSSEADGAYIAKVTDELITELKEFFKNNEKLVNRAVMAHVLSGLPVFFNNVDEIQEYIKNALAQCGDKAEKAAVTEIFRQLQADE